MRPVAGNPAVSTWTDSLPMPCDPYMARAALVPVAGDPHPRTTPCPVPLDPNVMHRRSHHDDLFARRRRVGGGFGLARLLFATFLGGCIVRRWRVVATHTAARRGEQEDGQRKEESSKQGGTHGSIQSRHRFEVNSRVAERSRSHHARGSLGSAGASSNVANTSIPSRPTTCPPRSIMRKQPHGCR